MGEKIIECIDKFYYIEFCKLIRENISKLKESKIIVFGAGIMGLQLSYVLEEFGLQVVAFWDNNPDKWGKIWGGCPVIKPDDTEKKEKSFLFLAMEEYKDCQAQLEKMGYASGDNLCIVASEVKNKYIEDFKGKNTAEVMVLGDCTLNVISLYEKDKTTLFEKISGNGADIKVLAQNGTYMRFYYNVLEMCIHNMNSLKKVILMFGLDIFSNRYHLLPANQHEDVLSEIYRLSGDTSEEYADFLKNVELRSKNNAINYSSPDRGLRDEGAILQEIKNHMKLNYLYNLREGNESTVYLSKFMNLCSANDILCIPVIMPVNYEFGIQLFSSEFITRYEKNKAVISERIEKRNGYYLDLSYQLPGDQFISVRSSNEGILADGREVVYNRICKYL